ncbi:hypothetical protein HYH02_003947 [Chlamydomonas schloesseri]|uniref:Uncharacterized protein n=1 Tax=Chlamydomonas schloesseri TaxID=2026947 RepID=A0A836B996_9CHLO|nr:hypothetical protein HYH02_003947 [Chlamydomonas schloesseri]|eukprot:KAG2451343.1 hypothetical protein HYH02_003947 [Chlamydomonas schloesseri]
MSAAAAMALPQPPPLAGWVRPAIDQFKRLELQYMTSLPLPLKKLLGDGDPKEFDADKHHMRLYGSVAFVLLGVKPCALLAHGLSVEYVQGLVDAALLPVAREHDLQGKGFVVEKIQHRLLTNNPVHPGFQGSWVLANTRHPGYDLARRTFLTPASADTGATAEPLPPYNPRKPKPLPAAVRAASTIVSEEQIGEALGYPLPGGEATVRYIDNTESKELDTCCVPVFEAFCPGGLGDLFPVLQHFAQYERAWAALGRDLTLDTQQHPMLGMGMQALREQTMPGAGAAGGGGRGGGRTGAAAGRGRARGGRG